MLHVICIWDRILVFYLTLQLLKTSHLYQCCLKLGTKVEVVQREPFPSAKLQGKNYWGLLPSSTLDFFCCNYNYYLFFFFFGKNFNLWCRLLMIALYHQTKTPISFWCKWLLNLRSLIQLSETLPVELTGTHNYYLLITKAVILYTIIMAPKSEVFPLSYHLVIIL